MNRLAILLSGRGSNFEAIADSIEQGRLDARIVIVISNRETAPGLERARQRGLPAICIPSKGIDRLEYDRLLIDAIREAKADFICLAGFLRLLSAEFTQAFSQRVLNIHPSLLPAFPGLDAQQQALEYGVQVTGCTVHFVDQYLDSGPIILQATVPVLQEDSIESLSARILKEEHRIYTEALRIVLAGRFRIEGRRVIEIDLSATAKCQEVPGAGSHNEL